MRHVSNDRLSEILEIGNLLGLKKMEIQEILTTNYNEDVKLTTNNPIDAYNNSVGYYGTVSIKDFI